MKSLVNLLKFANNSDALESDTKASLSKIASDCDIFKRTAAAPRRLKLTVGADDLRFNSSLQEDTMLSNNVGLWRFASPEKVMMRPETMVMMSEGDDETGKDATMSEDFEDTGNDGDDETGNDGDDERGLG